MWFYYF